MIEGKIARIRSGGQSGVDRAALDAAKNLGIPICGWCPKDGWAEDIQEPPGLLDKYPELTETESARVEQRTKLNVRDSDATLIIVAGIKDVSSGTAFTIEIAKQYERPFFIADLSSIGTEKVTVWINALGGDITLNVAGPRESKSPGIYDKSYKLLNEVLCYTRADI